MDAYLLTKTGRSDLADLRRVPPDPPLIEELKTLTRDQDQLIQMQTHPQEAPLISRFFEKEGHNQPF